MSLKEWWSKPWSKNLVFLGILSVLFFTEVGTWFQTKYVQWRLDAPKLSERSDSDIEGSRSIYRFDISIEDVEGNEISLSHFERKYVFLNMWASWCIPCIAELPGLEKLKESVSGMEMVALNIEDAPAFEKYLKNPKAELPYYRLTGSLPKELTPATIPASYLLGPDGKVIYQFIGAADWSDSVFSDELNSLIQ